MSVHETGDISLDDKVSFSAHRHVEWTQPTQFDLSSPVDRHHVGSLIDTGSITVHDPIESIADDMFELHHPELKHDSNEREKYVRSVGAQGLKYGQWFHFDWDNTLVRYPNEADFRDLKTYRNKTIVTGQEQDKLYDATTAVFGLSVGSSVVDQLTMAGIGGTQIIADHDTLAPSNLNRLRASFEQVGAAKIDIAAKNISKSDPYVRQVHMRNGVSIAALQELGEMKPDIIYDEIDDLAMKAMIRTYAIQNRIPVVMATDVGDTNIIDVERHDLQPTLPFNGRLKGQILTSMEQGRLSDKEKAMAVAKLIGVKNASPRLIQSSMNIDKTLGGMPQLGTTANMGGSLATVAGREILLGRKMESGRYVQSTKETLKLSSQVSALDAARIMADFIRTKRAR